MNRFFNNVELWFLGIGVNDDYTKINQVSMFLEGGTVDWLLAMRKEHPKGIENIWMWMQMRKVMCKQFVPKYHHILDTCNVVHIT